MKCTLTGDLTITVAAEVKVRLLEALAQGGPLEVDTSQVTDADASGLQVLLAAFKSAANAKIPVYFPQELHGPAVASGFRMLGLTGDSWSNEDRSHGKEDSGR